MSAEEMARGHPFSTAAAATRRIEEILRPLSVLPLDAHEPDPVLTMQVVGDPADPKTDIGPVIDPESRRALEAHVERLSREAKIVARAALPMGSEKGDLFAPTIAEIPTPDFLEREVFGPILHVATWRAGALEYSAAREHSVDMLIRRKFTTSAVAAVAAR